VTTTVQPEASSAPVLTAPKRTERERRREERRLAMQTAVLFHVQSLPVGAILWTPQGNELQSVAVATSGELARHIEAVVDVGDWGGVRKLENAGCWARIKRG
jgi:hypothetical protein